MIRWIALLLAWLTALPAVAATRVDNPHTTIEIIAESAAPAAGQPLALGLVLTPKPGWHTYWQNPGDAGAPTRVAWTLPPGTAEPPPLAYPVPETLIVSGLMNYVYARPNVLVTSVTPPAGLAKRTPFALSAKVDWLVCSLELCVPESATLTLPLVIGNGAVDPEDGYRIALARAAIPKHLSQTAHWAAANGRFVLAVPFGAPEKVRSAYFFAAADGAIDYAAPQQVTVAGEALRIETKAGTKPARTCRRGAARRARGRGADRVRRHRATRRSSCRRGAARRRSPGRRSRAAMADPARRDARRHRAQRHAVRVPDPQPQGAQPRQGQCRAVAGARRCAGLCARRDPRLHGARRRGAAAAPRRAIKSAGRSSCRIRASSPGCCCW